MRAALAIAACLVLAACGQRPAQQDSQPAADATRITTWLLPTPPGATSPDLRLDPDGRLLLSWLQPSNKTVLHCRPEEAARSRAQPLFKWERVLPFLAEPIA